MWSILWVLGQFYGFVKGNAASLRVSLRLKRLKVPDVVLPAGELTGPPSENRSPVRPVLSTSQTERVLDYVGRQRIAQIQHKQINVCQ